MMEGVELVPLGTAVETAGDTMLEPFWPAGAGAPPFRWLGAGGWGMIWDGGGGSCVRGSRSD